MRQYESTRKKRQSRRRKGSRRREILGGFMKLMLTFLLILVLIAGGVFGYRYWKGNKTNDAPLETSREVIPETMSEAY